MAYHRRSFIKKNAVLGQAVDGFVQIPLRSPVKELRPSVRDR